MTWGSVNIVKIASNSMKMTAVVDDARLVQEIRKYGTLYDSRKRGNKDLPEKGQAWEAVSAELGIPPLDAKNRWRNLRDRFVREKKRVLNDGEQVYGQKDPWPLLEDMSFLWDFITHRNHPYATDSKRKVKKNFDFSARGLQPILPRPSPEWVNVTLEYDTPDASPAAVPIPLDPQCLIIEDSEKVIKQEPCEDSGSHLRRLLVDGNTMETEELHLVHGETEDVTAPTREVSKDEDQLFCLSVAAAFKRFSPKMKALAKWKIQQVLYDVEFNQSGSSNAESVNQKP